MKRPLALAAAGAMAVGLVAIPASAASAAPVPAQRVQRVTTFGNGNAGFASRRFVDQGALTLTWNDRNRWSQDHGAQFTVVAVNRGFSITSVQRAINLQLNEHATPAQAALSTRLINREAVAYGGIDALGHRSDNTRSTTINLDHSGRYWVLNTVNGTAAIVGTFFAGHNTAATPRNISRPSALLVAGFRGIDRFFGANGFLPRHGVLAVANLGDTIHVVTIQRVANGVTDAQVQAEFNVIMAGHNPTTDPAGLNSTPSDLTGVDAISPHHQARLRYHLPRGTYLALCFVADSSTGVPHAFMGMHKILHVA